MSRLTDKQKHTICLFGVWLANADDVDVYDTNPLSFFKGFIAAHGHSVFEADEMRYSNWFNERVRL